MKKIKIIIISLIILGSLFFLFSSLTLPEGFQVQEIFDLAAGNDVIIIFNSGGWGNTPPDKADDFLPVISGLQEILRELNYQSVVISYQRTKDGFFGENDRNKRFF